MLRPRHPYAHLSLPVLVLLLAPAWIISPLAAAERPPALLSSTGEARLELASGERVTARLPADAALEATATLDTGWLAAGTEPGAGPLGGRDLLLLTGDGKTVSTLPPPPERTAALRQEPLPLVAEGRLAGLVWLEGSTERALGVRFAAWNGAGWESPRSIAPPGPGSQLALAAAFLRDGHDGSWLLAWSAFDGHDDEIVWSRERNGVWSKPRRVDADNGVPDITPALTAAGASGDGALLAWSRYDGNDYRLMVSRFQNGTWGRPQAVGVAGTLFPSFEPVSAGPASAIGSGGALLLYRTAAPRGWTALALDAAGRPGRRASLLSSPSAENARPLLSLTAGGVTFRWPAADPAVSGAGERIERVIAWERRP
jgi:hypothetical protein